MTIDLSLSDHIQDEHDSIIMWTNKYNRLLQKTTQVLECDDVEGYGDTLEDALEDLCKKLCKNHEDECDSADFDEETGVTSYETCSYSCHDMLDDLS